MAKKPIPEKKHWDAKLSHKVRHTILTVLITLFIVGGGAYGYFFFTQDIEASINHTPGVGTVKTIASPAADNLRFDEDTFYMSLPPDWKKTGQLTTGPHRKYSYQSTLKNADNRFLDVYVDVLPLDMAVNKAVAVHAEGARLTHGMVSDNCTTFTMKSSSTTYKAPAKWDGVDFLCDMDATTRNVVGTSAPGSVNKVELSTDGFTKRAFFLAYTDNNFHPDYGIFYDVLESFSAK